MNLVDHHVHCPERSLYKNVIYLFGTVFTGLLVAGQIGANNSTSESSSASWPSRWWTKSEKTTTSKRSELLQQKLERDREAWLTRNGEKNVEEEIIINLTKHIHNKNETEASLSLLENIVTPEEEILDELNDRQIIQAVVTSMAQWNLRKLQKIQRRKDEGYYSIKFTNPSDFIIEIIQESSKSAG